MCNRRVGDPPLNPVQDLARRNEFMQPWRVCEFKLEIIREKCRWDTGESGNGVRIRDLETLTFLAYMSY